MQVARCSTSRRIELAACAMIRTAARPLALSSVDSPRPIGILGGTFDPIHYAHLRLAEELADALALQQVRFIPASIPPHRATPQRDRRRTAWRWCGWPARATRAFVVDDRECRRQGPSYTVDTLLELRAELGDEQPLVLLMGVDAFLALDDVVALGAAVRAGPRRRSRTGQASRWMPARLPTAAGAAARNPRTRERVCSCTSRRPACLAVDDHAARHLGHRDPRRHCAKGAARAICFPTPFSIIFTAINCIRTGCRLSRSGNRRAGAGRDQGARHRGAGYPQADVDVRLHDRRERGIDAADQGAGAQRRRRRSRPAAAACSAARASRPENGYWWTWARRRPHHAACDPRLLQPRAAVGRGSVRAASRSCAAAPKSSATDRHAARPGPKRPASRGSPIRTRRRAVSGLRHEADRLAVGHRMPAWVSAGFDEYARRMPRESRIELVEDPARARVPRRRSPRP